MQQVLDSAILIIRKDRIVTVNISSIIGLLDQISLGIKQQQQKDTNNVICLPLKTILLYSRPEYVRKFSLKYFVELKKCFGRLSLHPQEGPIFKQLDYNVHISRRSRV